MANEDITTLIAGLQIEYPRLYQALMTLQDRIFETERELFPLVREAQESTATAAAVTAPATFTFVFTTLTVRLTWSEVIGASQYEVRRGANWDTAAFQFRSNSLQADIDPLLVGTYTYLIKSINGVGDYSAEATQCVVAVPDIGIVNINKSVIDNNILLSWNAPSSTFAILHYEIYKDGVAVGTILGTFFVRFEAVGGTYEYKVIALDIASNRSPDALISVTVTSPPDYVLQDQRTTSFDGTKVNTRKEEPASLVATVNTETWQEHFLTRVWSDPDDQVNAGYPIYIQPTADTGSYQETIDYGAILANVIVTYTFLLEVIVDGVTIIISTEASDDGISWTLPQLGSSVFVSSMRYLRLTLTFTPTV